MLQNSISPEAADRLMMQLGARYPDEPDHQPWIRWAAWAFCIVGIPLIAAGIRYLRRKRDVSPPEAQPAAANRRARSHWPLIAGVVLVVAGAAGFGGYRIYTAGDRVAEHEAARVAESVSRQFPRIVITHRCEHRAVNFRIQTFATSVQPETARSLASIVMNAFEGATRLPGWTVRCEVMDAGSAPAWVFDRTLR